MTGVLVDSNLFVKYQNLPIENSKLKEEIRTLKACLAGVELEIPVAESSEESITVTFNLTVTPPELSAVSSFYIRL